VLFDTSRLYGAVIGARHTGTTELLSGGVAEYGRFLGNMVGHLHLIDSDGSCIIMRPALTWPWTGKHRLYECSCDDEAGNQEFTLVVRRLLLQSATPTAGREAVPVVRRLMEEVLK